MYCRCVVSNAKSPNAVLDTESSVPVPAVNVDSHHGATLLLLANDHASSVVIVRSSKPGPPSYWLLRRLRRYVAVTSCPAAHGNTAFNPTFSVA